VTANDGENVMNKKMLSMITALTVVAGAFGAVGARTIAPANGTYTDPANDGSFSYSVLNGSVLATGIAANTVVPWQLGLALDTFGAKTAFVRSRAATGGAQWRLRCVSPTGASVSTSAFINIPVMGSYGLQQRSATAPANGTCFIDARMNSGASILNVRYNQ